MSEISIAQAVHMALERHRAGQLQEAESIYRQILAVEPNNVDALHLLGVLAHQGGQHEQSIDLIERAISLHPGIPEHHINLASAYRALRKRDDAARHLERAIVLRPRDPLAQTTLAAVYFESGQMDRAAPLWRKLTELEPKADGAGTRQRHSFREPWRLARAQWEAQ
jgi:protein O-GlcNAc transferase